MLQFLLGIVLQQFGSCTQIHYVVGDGPGNTGLGLSLIQLIEAHMAVAVQSPNQRLMTTEAQYFG